MSLQQAESGADGVCAALNRQKVGTACEVFLAMLWLGHRGFINAQHTELSSV